MGPFTMSFAEVNHMNVPPLGAYYIGFLLLLHTYVKLFLHLLGMHTLEH